MHQTEVAIPESTSIFSSLPPFDSLFWRPRYIIDSPIIEHIVVFFWLVSAIRPALSVVVGAGDGVAHFTLCQAIDKLNLSGRCQGFGFWYDQQKQEFAYKAPEALREHAAQLYEDVSELRGFDTNQAALDSIALQSVDLLFVDLTNLADGDVPQIGEWLRCLRAHGILVLHGTKEIYAPGSSFAQLVASLSEHQKIYFDDGNGLTILHKDGAAPPRLKALFDASEGGAIPHEIGLLFRRLGQGLVYQSRQSALFKQVDRLTCTLRDAEKSRSLAEKALTEISILHEDCKRKTWEYQSSLHDLRQQLAQLTSSEVELGGKLKASLVETQDLTRKLRELKDGQAQSNVRTNELQALLQEKNSEIEKANEVHYNETALLTKALEVARVQLAQAHDEVRALRTSTSWKLTAPLRRAKLGLFTK